MRSMMSFSYAETSTIQYIYGLKHYQTAANHGKKLSSLQQVLQLLHFALHSFRKGILIGAGNETAKVFNALLLEVHVVYGPCNAAHTNQQQEEQVIRCTNLGRHSNSMKAGACSCHKLLFIPTKNMCMTCRIVTCNQVRTNNETRAHWRWRIPHRMNLRWS